MKFQMNSFKRLGVMTLAALGTILCPLAQGQGAGNDVYQAIVKREFGTASNEMAAIEQEIQDAKAEQYQKIEARLVSVLESPEATMPGKQFACQMLRIVGSAKCVPAVSKLLVDDQLSHMARYVLQGMRDPLVDAALRKALGQTHGKLRLGVIDTLGDRGDRLSLEAVANMLKENDEATILCALNALGKIGGVHAADMLERAKLPGRFREAWAHAYLRTAGSVAAAGKVVRAEKIYQSLFDGDYPPVIRAAAFPAIAQMQKERAVPLIVKTLFSNDPIMRRAAVSAVISVPSNAATRALVQALPGLAPENKAALLEVLALRGDAAGIPESVNKLAGDDNLVVRQAAIRALGHLGSAASIPVLAATLKEGGTAGADASKSLAELQAEGVTDALIKQAEAGDTAVREAVLKVLAERRQLEALPVFRKAVSDQDAKIRRSGLTALAMLGTGEDLERLVETLVASKDDSERGPVAGAISEIGGRITDITKRCEPVLRALPKADASTKAAMLTVLSTWGGDKALQAVRASLAGDGDVRKAAVQALAHWPDPAPMPDLLAVAKEGNQKSDQIVALRGYIRMAGLTGGKARLQSYREAMGVATRPEEKWSVLAGVAEVPQVEALKMAEGYLEDAALEREAFAAYEKIAESLASRQPAAAKEALQRVAEKASDNGLRNKAKAALEKLKK